MMRRLGALGDSLQSALKLGSLAMQEAIALLVALFLVLQVSAPQPVCAASFSLIRVGGLRQNVDLGYQYQRQTTDADGSQNLTASSHLFEESYGASVRYAIISPAIINGTFSAKAEFSQEETATSDRSNDRTNTDRYSYNLRGIALQKSWYPASFFNYLEYSREQQPFLPGQDLRISGTGGTLSLRNQYLPTFFSYNRQSTRATGSGSDSDNSTETFLLSTSHSYRDISQTSLSFSLTNSETSSPSLGLSSNSEIRTGQFKHLLNLGQNSLQRNLTSTLLSQSESGVANNRSLEVNETLDWDLGKALRSNLVYLYRDRTYGGSDVVENSGTGWLQHQLFRSLTTRLSGRSRHNQYDFGTISENGGGITLDYQKILPADSQLTLGIGYDYGVIDNSLTDSTLSITDEQHNVGNLSPYEFVLERPDVIADSIRVMNKTRTYVYLLGIDYTLVQEGRVMRIVLPQVPSLGPVPIVPDAILSVDYQYLVNPSVKYALTQLNGSASLSLQNNRYRFYLRGSDSSQKVLESQGTSAGLVSSSTFVAGFEVRREFVSYGGAYQRVSSSVSSGQAFDGFWRYARTFGRSDLRINLRERYALHSNNDTGSTSYTNTLSLIADYTRPLLSWVSLRLQGRYLMLRGRAPSDEVGLISEIVAQFGKTEALFGTESVWRFNPDVDTSDILIRLRLNRYF